MLNQTKPKLSRENNKSCSFMFSIWGFRFKGLRDLYPAIFAPCKESLSDWLIPHPVSSSPQLMSLWSPLSSSLHFHSFTQGSLTAQAAWLQWLSQTAKKEALTLSICHVFIPPKPVPYWRHAKFSCQLQRDTCIPLNHIFNSIFFKQLLPKSKQTFRLFPFLSWKFSWVRSCPYGTFSVS